VHETLHPKELVSAMKPLKRLLMIVLVLSAASPARSVGSEAIFRSQEAAAMVHCLLTTDRPEACDAIATSAALPEGIPEARCAPAIRRVGERMLAVGAEVRSEAAALRKKGEAVDVRARYLAAVHRAFREGPVGPNEVGAADVLKAFARSCCRLDLRRAR